MTDTGEFLLGIIAFAVLVMALIQVAAIVAGIRLAKRVNQLTTQLDQEIKPLIANLNALSRQAERLDRVFGELVERVDGTLAAALEFVTGPARQGMAILAGVKAVIEAFRGMRETSRRRTASRPAVDDEESLFIG